MRDFTGREMVKLSDVKEGDTVELRAGANTALEAGVYTVKTSHWGLFIPAPNGWACYLSEWTINYEDGEAYLSGVYPFHPKTEETPVTDSHLTEAEMRAFFEKLASYIVGASKQAEELKSVQAQVAELDEKFTRQSEYVIKLEAQNQNLQSQVHQLSGVIDGKNNQINDLTAERDLYVEQNTALHKDIEVKNDTIRTLEAQLDDAKAGIETHERTIQDRDRELAEVREQLRLIMEDRDNTSKLYSDTRDELVEAQRKLRGVEDAIRGMNATFGQNVVNF